MRVAEKFYLKDASMKAEYIRRHNELWPAMAALIGQAGIRNYTIWASGGGELFAYYEVDDMERCAHTLGHAAIKAKWDAYMSDIICFDDQGPELLEQMFLLE